MGAAFKPKPTLPAGPRLPAPPRENDMLFVPMLLAQLLNSAYQDLPVCCRHLVMAMASPISAAQESSPLETGRRPERFPMERLSRQERLIKRSSKRVNMSEKPIKPSGSELDLSKASEVEERLAVAVEKMREQALQLQEKQLAGEHSSVSYRRDAQS